MKNQRLFICLGLGLLLYSLISANAASADDWIWEFMGVPMGETSIQHIYLDPDDDDTWYVTSSSGVYITRDGGDSWENHLSGDSRGFAIDPNNHSRLYASSAYELHKSNNKGQSWTLVHTFSEFIRSAHVRQTDSSVLVGVNWLGSATPNGVYKSTNWGADWDLYDFDAPEDNLLLWDIDEDPINDILYVATEIADHPSPYEPPMFRSTNGGDTWTEISGTLPWHVYKMQVHPLSQDVYVMTESLGLYESTDHGDTWTFLNNEFWLDFLIDTNYPSRFFGGNHTWGSWDGGVFGSYDTGQSFEMIGLFEEVVTGLALDSSSTWLYATCYETGIYRGRLPRAWYVTPDGTGDFLKIQDAVSFAADGDTVLLASAIFDGPGNYDVDIMGKSILICSEDGNPEQCVIACEGLGRAFYCDGADSGTRLRGLGIVNGSATGTGSERLGGAIFYENSTGSPVFEDCIFMGCFAEGHGGAVHAGYSSEPIVRNCRFIENSCGSSGGAFICGYGDEVCSPSFYDCLFLRNTAPSGGGGAISGGGNAGYAILRRSVFGGNEASYGGAVRLSAGTVTVDSCTFAYNEATTGGGLYASGSEKNIDNSIIAFSTEGRAIHCSGGGSAQLTCCDVYGNAGGDWNGCIAGQDLIGGNLSVDPIFCDPLLEDYSLDAVSLCLPAHNACGKQIGALGEGCNESAIDSATPALKIGLMQNRPNPFSNATTLAYSLPVASAVTLEIYDPAGRKVVTLVNGVLEAGQHNVTWRGLDDDGIAVASGSYLAKLKTSNHERSVTISLVR